MKYITTDEWEKTYKPVMEGESYMDIGYDHPRVREFPNNIWTRLSFDDDCCDDYPDCECPDEVMADIFNGAHWVNRMEYYYCGVAFDPDEQIAVY